MDKMDPHNELIDRYLRGELSGKDLADFEQKLVDDAEFSKEVEIYRNLVTAIQAHGAAQLKQFIRSRTTQKKGMFIAFRTWYYAAAAVGLILIASVVLLLNQNNNKTENAFAVQDVQTDKQLEQSNNDITTDENEKAGTTEDPANPVIANAGSRPDVIEDLPFSDESDDFHGAAEGLDVMAVASNIPVIPIRVESIVKAEENLVQTSTAELESKKPATVRKSLGINQNQLDKKRDSLMRNEAKQEADAERLAIETSKFNLNFFNNFQSKPQIVTNRTVSKSEPALISVYNLPYDNPLIFEYKNRFFLKAGDMFYEFNPNKTGAQDVTPVKDAEVLAALNQ